MDIDLYMRKNSKCNKVFIQVQRLKKCTISIKVFFNASVCLSVLFALDFIEKILRLVRIENIFGTKLGKHFFPSKIQVVIHEYKICI